MKFTNTEYDTLAKKHSKNSNSLRNIPLAFLSGGAICLIGQLLITLFKRVPLAGPLLSTAVSITLIFLGVLLTGVRLYGKLALYAGAGFLVPITGFANAIASPAIEYKSEGYVAGTCIKMFTIAGPVIVYGVCASVIYGVIYYIAAGR